MSTAGNNLHGATGRLATGKAAEEKIAQAVIAFGIPLQPVTEQEDMIAKVDRKVEWTEDLARKFPLLHLPLGTLYVQIKNRETGVDLLLDAYEPFYGLTNEQTKEGRDFIGKYDIYICGTKDGITIANAQEVKSKAITIIVLWGLRCGNDRPYENRISPYWYNRNEPVSMCIMDDHCNGRTKMIVFVSPKIITKKYQLT